MTNNQINTVHQLIGQTPIVPLPKVQGAADIYVKLESSNPGGSVKDRIARAMLEDAQAKGVLPGKTVIEATSGNTGIGLAMICAAWKIPLTLVMPENMSIERQKLFSAYGAKLILTAKSLGMKGAIDKVTQLVEEDSQYLHVNQFANPANPRCHYETTGPEIHQYFGDELDALVSGIGTGGTISGAGRYLKEHNPKIQVIGLEPSESPVLSGGEKGPHEIQGIGAGFVPDTLSLDLVDEIHTIASAEAKKCARHLASEAGILAGISSGAALSGALRASRRLGPGHKVLMMAPDTGERYLSTDLFDHRA